VDNEMLMALFSCPGVWEQVVTLSSQSDLRTYSVQ